MRTKRFYLLLYLVIISCAKGVQHSPKKPNVLFILVDDLGWKDLGCYGSSFYETPNIDLLASQSYRFTNAYSSNPVCSPTRASIMTGKHPSRIGITDWITSENPPSELWNKLRKNQKLIQPKNKHALPLEEFTMAEALQTAGYPTFYAGKWHLGDEGFLPQDQGFEINKGGHIKGSPPGGYYTPYNNPQLEDGPKGEYLTDRLTDESIAFMEQNKENPFFLYLAFYTVHTPIQANLKYLEKFKQKRSLLKDSLPIKVKEQKGYTVLNQYNASYASMVYALDQNVGRLINKLKTLNLLENTLIIFTSDNGGLSTLIGKTVYGRSAPTSVLPLRAGKGWAYEGGIRVPLIIKPPNNFQAKTIDAPANSMDYYPTVLDYTGIGLNPDQHIDGISLKPLLDGETSVTHKQLIWDFPHYHGSGWTPGRAIRKGPWKLIYFFENHIYELYNLDNDIGERNNLAANYPEKFEEMKKLLNVWSEEIKAKKPIINKDFK